MRTRLRPARRGRQTSTSINYAAPANKGGAPSPKLSQRNSGIAAVLMRAHQERAECGSGGKLQRRNFLIIRVNVSGEGGGSLAVCGAPLAPGLCANLRAGYIIEKMPPANRQLGRGLLDEFSPTKTDTPSENTWLRSTIPGILHATTALTGYCVVSISPARLLACRIAVFKLRSRPLFPCSCVCVFWQALDDGLLYARTSRRGPRRAIGPVLRRGAPSEENGCASFACSCPP